MESEIPAAIALPAEPDGHSYELTGLARGPWAPDAAHGGAPVALITREAEKFGAEDGLRLASLSSTFYGPVALGKIEIEAEVVKPGRRQKVVRVILRSGDRVAIEATGILLRQAEVPLPDGINRTGPPLSPPEEGEGVDNSLWAAGNEIAFHRTTNTVLKLDGGPDEVGHTGTAWFRLEYPLVPGEDLSPLQRAAAAADFGNGLAHPVPFGEYLFVNCDLSFSTFRDPVGDWIGLVSRTDVDPVGSGLTTTELHDRSGRFGAASQSLYVDQVR
ncbi:MAG: thioesterase family protein [Solirubrobacterales bacterium]